MQSLSLQHHRPGTSEGLTWPISQRRRVPGAWPTCQGNSGEGPQAETHPAVCLLTCRLVGTRAVWRVHLVNAGCAKGGGTTTLPSEPTAWRVRQTGPRRLPSDAASVRTEVGTQPCHSGGLLSPCQARAEKASGAGMCGRNLGHQRVGSGALRLPEGHELWKQPLQRPRDRKDQIELGESQVDRPGWSMIRLSCICYLGVNNPSLSLILFSFLKKKKLIYF